MSYLKLFIICLLAFAQIACDQIGECHGTAKSTFSLQQAQGSGNSFQDIPVTTEILTSDCTGYSAGELNEHWMGSIEIDEETVTMALDGQVQQMPLFDLEIGTFEKFAERHSCEIHIVGSGELNRDQGTLTIISEISATGVTCELAGSL